MVSEGRIQNPQNKISRLRLGFPAEENFRENLRKFSYVFRKLFRKISRKLILRQKAKTRRNFTKNNSRKNVKHKKIRSKLIVLQLQQLIAQKKECEKMRYFREKIFIFSWKP